MMTIEDQPSGNGAALFLTDSINENARFGLALLSQAFKYAHDAGAERWDFAVEIDRLFRSGLSISQLRWLVAKKFAEHGQESCVYGSPHRSFRRGNGFFFDHTTCVVLTSSGAAFVDHLLRETNDPSISIDAILKPCWDRSRRELSLRGMVVKRYLVPARNQQVILGAFEEEGWPDQIDDPLPVTYDINPRTRLHDAINRLNNCQTNRLLTFRGNGNGTGVLWELRQTKGRGFRNLKPRAMQGDWPEAIECLK